MKLGLVLLCLLLVQGCTLQNIKPTISVRAEGKLDEHGINVPISSIISGSYIIFGFNSQF